MIQDETDTLPGATPLVVDLDGTLIRSDLLMESFWRGMGIAPVLTVLTSLRLLRQRAKLKKELADLAPPALERIPTDPDVVAMIAEARQAGRPVHLVSGSTATLVERIGEHLGPFDGVQGSDEVTNLTGPRKRDWLISRFGEGGYDYIGDSTADVPVWAAARTAYVATPQPVGAAWNRAALLRGLRPHQWLKNALLLLPLLAAHRTDIAGLAAAFLGIIAFSALASSIYIVNDFTDLDADRQHEKKCKRPFASGAVPIRIGMLASVCLGVTGLILGAVLGPWMVLVLLVYLVATLSYSMHLKRVRWVDVTMLASLYTLRVVAGAVAAGVAASGWLIGFIFPVFLSLGCVKRLTELSKATGTGFLPGRRYRASDRDDLLNVAIVAGIAAVGIFVAYSLSATAGRLYESVWSLWTVAGLLAAWLVRMIYTGWTGQQDYDPIVYAITDRIGVSLVLAAMAVLIIGAS